MTEPKWTRPIKLSGRALYDDGQMINSNVINHVTKEARGSSETSRVQRGARGGEAQLAEANGS